MNNSWFWYSERASPTQSHPKRRYVSHPRQMVTLRLPGDGGFYSPLERDSGRVLKDVKQGYFSPKCGQEKYGVVIMRREWL